MLLERLGGLATCTLSIEPDIAGDIELIELVSILCYRESAKNKIL